MKFLTSRKEGMSMIPVAITSTFVVSAAAGIMVVASQQSHAINRQRDIVKSKAIAEAGVHQAYSALRTDFSSRENGALFSHTALGGGSFDVSVTAIGDDKARISSTGSYDDADMQVILDVQLQGGGDEPLDPEVDPYAHAIYAAGDFRCNGNGSMVGSGYTGADFRINGSSTWNADIMARASATVIGGNSVFNGTVWSPSIGGSGAGGISNPVAAAVPALSFPVIDLTEYYNIAVANGQVYSGSNNANGNIGAINGGVRWYNGNVKFKGGVNYTGCIIATGYIWFNGGMTQSTLGALPAAVSRDSYIRFNGSRSCQGLIYAAGDVTFNGSGTLAGTVISGGDITLNGLYGVITYKKSVPGSSNPSSNPTEATLAVKAWQK